MAEREIIRQEGKRGGGKYRAFLLRCWQEEGERESKWRFTLVQIGNGGSKKGFGCLEDVMAYLSDILEAKENNIFK